MMQSKTIVSFFLCVILLSMICISAFGANTNASNPYTVSVLDYGAKGNGSTDDTKAIQKAIDKCPAHGSVFLPWTGNSYKISSTLIVNKPITIYSNYYGYEINERTDVASMSEVGTPLIQYTGTGFAMEIHSIGVQLENIVMHTNGGGIYTTGNKSSTAPYSRYNRFTNVFIRCMNGTTVAHVGFNFTNAFRTIIENCEVFDAYVGFYINDGTSITMTNCWARDYRLYGYRVENLVYSTLINCCADTTPKPRETYQVAYSLSNCDTIGFVNCGAENVGAEVLALDHCYGMTCSFHMIGSNKYAGNAPIYVNNSEAVFIGCRNNTSATYALKIYGNSCVTLVGCTAMEKALVSGYAMHCDGRLWVYPSV